MPEVPRYRLYGEPAARAKSSFLHIEAIDTRSRQHGWIIQPHSHGDLHQLFLVLQGGGIVRMQGANWECRAPALLNFPADIAHGFEWTAGTDGYVLTIAAPVLSDLARRYPDLGKAVGQTLCAAWPEPSPPLAELRRSMQALMTEIAWSESAASPVAEAHLLLCLVAVMSQCRQGEGEGTAFPGRLRDDDLFERFRREVEEAYRMRATVPELARRIGVSERRLGAVCRAIAGCSPLEVLHARRLAEAKRKLLYTIKPVAEIAYELGYEDPAYFTRFFTLRSGCSPRDFRRASRE